MKLMFKIVLLLLVVSGSAQEYVRPLNGNVNLMYRQPAKPLKNNYVERVAATGDTLDLPIFEDFYYAPDSPYPSGKIWTDSSVYVNTGFARAPLSIGVATFDGLNRHGFPYNIGATAIVSTFADTLTSKPIALGNKGAFYYQPSDSVGFSFFYQRQGYGNSPEIDDSLIVEFYKPMYPVISGTNTTYGKWIMAWSSKGSNSSSPSGSDSLFKRVFVRITDTAYFHNGFRVRFRNKATPTGNVDQWHVDFIKLATNSMKSDTTLSDVTFGYVPKMPWLKNYSSMPWWQFNSSETDTTFANFIRNNSDSTATGDKNVKYKYNIYSASNALLYSKDLGSATVKAFNPRGWDKSPPHLNPGCTFTSSPLSDSTHFLFRHYIDKITNDVWNYNDTVNQRIIFNNYYAYDDGSAEQGWGLFAFGAKTALKFNLNVTDTLRALDIYFDPVIDGNAIQSSGFRLCVWGDGSTQPGSLILRDSVQYPKYLKLGYNQFPRYLLTSPLIMSPGTYYIGMQQVSNQTLSIGMDMNYDAHTRLYIDYQGYWEQSQVNGALMIHPVFGHADRAMVGINETAVKSKENIIKVYPNPANDKLFISTSAFDPKDRFRIELYSVLGTKLSETEMRSELSGIDLSEFASGIYFVALKRNGQTISYEKFIIAR